MTAPAPSLYAATERSEQLQRRLFRHLHDVALVGNRERAKGRLAEEMTVHPSAIVEKSAAAVRSPAAEIVCVEVDAIGRTSLCAKPAMTAGHE
jgi:hypothetical protein